VHTLLMNRNRARLEFFLAGGALTGLLVAIAVFCLGYWENSHLPVSSSADGVIQLAILCVCPASLALMAGDNANGLERGFLMVVIALINVAWYVFLGLLLFKLKSVHLRDR
jgi:hypothetical protein